jgi:hypothetical protein
MKTKVAPKSSKKSKPREKSDKTQTVRHEDEIVLKFLRQNSLSVELIDKLWSTLLEKQQTISHQIEESEKKYNRRLEQSNQLIRKSENKFFSKMEEKKQYLTDNAVNTEIEEDDEEYKKTGKGSKKTKQSVNKKSVKTARSGELDEYTACSEIIKRFNELRLYFDDITLGGRRILDNNGKTKAEFNIILENLQCLTVVETIANPNKKDIERFINSLEILREHRNKYKDHRKIYGAIIGDQLESAEKQAILEKGIYLFEESGRTVKSETPDHFVPLEI